MEIFPTPDNPAPPGAIVPPVRTGDDLMLRVVRWVPHGEPLGTVAILPGRTEFVEKYFEVTGELLARGLVVVALDWRGQGLSERDLKDPRKGHVDDFAFYERDLDALHQQVLQFLCPQPWFALGHSDRILPGRTEFVEKYFEVTGELLARGLVVVALDWRGQGLSERDLKDPRKGHVDDFAFYERDLDALHQQVLQFLCPQPWFALGHSMGASILLAQARDGRSPFARMVLTAPMIDIAGLRVPRLVRALIEGLDMVGLGTAYVLGGSQKATLECGFEGNDLTSDPIRFARLAGILQVAPQLGLGGPTVGWLNAAFRLIDEFADAEYPRRTFTPTLVLGAGKDPVVPLHAVERRATRLKVGRLIVLSDSRHEILMERDHIRGQFWAAFDPLIPGEHFSVPALEASAEAKRSLRSHRRWFRRHQVA